MRISRVKVSNYRNLKKVDVELGNIVTLVGENNSGKSNFLKAISIPLSSENGGSKRLSWYDINKDAKKQYYDFLKENKSRIIDSSLKEEEFNTHIPIVSICLEFTPADNEHYDVKDILINPDKWIGGIQYRFFIKKPNELLKRVKEILTSSDDCDNIQMSLLPVELYEHSITVPGSESKVSYDVLSKLCSVNLPVERDNFSSNVDKLGSRALSDLLQKNFAANSQVKVERAYQEFFNTVKKEGKLDKVLNWQEYSNIENAQDFFKHISILPNMPQMSSILGSIRLGYNEENMFMQGLGYRNLILIAVLLNSYMSSDRDFSFRLLTVEEPEAHLCVSNVLLIASLFNIFSQKNEYTQIVYSTHNVEFVNKIGIDRVVVLHNGEAYSLKNELTNNERDYFATNPNIDIFKLLYSKQAILVEGITEELLIKSYLQTKKNLNEIKVLSFHKGFTKIIDIWKKINKGSNNKLGVVRDFDNQPNAQRNHELLQNENVIIKTTQGYTLESDIVDNNYELLKNKYGDEYGWSNLTVDALQKDWRENKSDIMLRICHDLIDGDLDGFVLPPHIKEIIDFMQGTANEG